MPLYHLLFFKFYFDQMLNLQYPINNLTTCTNKQHVNTQSIGLFIVLITNVHTHFTRNSSIFCNISIIPPFMKKCYCVLTRLLSIPARTILKELSLKSCITLCPIFFRENCFIQEYGWAVGIICQRLLSMLKELAY